VLSVVLPFVIIKSSGDEILFSFPLHIIIIIIIIIINIVVVVVISSALTV
jgi:hypothetical protein